MTKKYFTVPYLKVVEVKNDIIATSMGIGDPYTDGNYTSPIQERHGMWDEEFCEDDLY